MSTFLTLGLFIGAIIGALHARSIYRDRIASSAGTGEAVWFALWTFGLWTLFGAYLLALWILGAFGMAASRLWPSKSAAR